MGGRRDSSNGIKHNVIEHFCMESKAYKICERVVIRKGNATLLTNAMNRNES
jgi:hypothetical protein